MGLRFMVVSNSKRWTSPAHSASLLPLSKSSFISSSSFVYLLQTVRGRQAYVNFGLPLQHTVLDRSKLPHGVTMKAKASFLHEVECIESIFEEPSKLKVDWSSRISENLNKQITKKNDSSEFSLLMENIDRIEDLIAGADLVTLEKEILTQITRLGALKLFHTCLSRILMESTMVNSNFVIDKHLSDRSFGVPLDEKKGSSRLVQSGKKEQRKLRRVRASENATKMSVAQISKKGRHKIQGSLSFQQSGLRKFTGVSRSKHSREVRARNESEMSMGVKDLSNLEKICKVLEEEIGQPPSFTRWAEAAGLDQKTLKSRLQFGWFCRDNLLRSSRSLVMFIAKNYRGMGIAFDDLLQVGFAGVLNGAERYDIKKGYRFSTYVQHWIRKSILAMIARHSRTIQVPVRMDNMIKRIQKERRTFYDREGRQPEDEELAELTGLSLANIRLAIKCSRPIGSIQKEIRDGWHTKFMEVTPDPSVRTPDEVITKKHIREEVLNLLQTLHPRERQVLVLRYGLEDGRCKSLQEIGRLCQVTKEWIRKIEKEALLKIRSEELQENLSHYLQ